MCVCVCVSHFVSERSAILLDLLIKLTKETRGRDWRGRDLRWRDMERDRSEREGMNGLFIV